MTLRELVTLAGVSKTTFYEHFESKQDCFFATFEEIMARADRRVGAAHAAAAGDQRQRLLVALRAFMELVVEEPAAATLVAADSLTLGTAGFEPRERGWRGLERLVSRSFESSPSRAEVPPATVRAIVAGVCGVVYRRLRDGQAELLPGCVDELVDWSFRYQRREAALVRRVRRAGERAIEAEAPPSGPRTNWVGRSRPTARAAGWR